MATRFLKYAGSENVTFICQSGYARAYNLAVTLLPNIGGKQQQSILIFKAPQGEMSIQLKWG